MKHYTSIEQSKKLLELGLDPSTADMIYSVVNNDNVEYPDKPSLYRWGNSSVLYNYMKNIGRESVLQDIPCWSVGALLDLLPDNIEVDNAKWHLNTVHRKKDNWQFMYYGRYRFCRFYGDNPLDACYELIVWLLENEYAPFDEKV